MKKQNTKKPLVWIFKIYKRFIPATLLVCVFSAITSLSFILMAFLSKNILEIATGDKIGSLKIYAISILTIVILQVCISSVSSLLRAQIGGKFTIALREYLFALLNSKKYSLTSKYHSGDILNRFTSDTGIIVSNIVNILPDISAMLAKIIGGTAALLTLEPTIAIIVLVFGVVVPAFGRLINKRYKYLHKECQRTEGIITAFLQECFENSIVIKTFKSEKPFIERLKQYMTENYNLRLKRTGFSIFANVGIYSFFTIGYYAVFVWGASQISKGAISFGTLIAFLQLVSQLSGPLQNITSILPRYYTTVASAERLMEFEELESEPKADANFEPIDFEYLECSDITFSYDNKNVLENFNCKIQKGDVIAVTGSSGSGKSTLFKLILGLYETQNGSITINGTTPATALTRHLFAYVPQGNMILSGSIMDNLTMCNPDIPLNDVINACKTAEIHDYISSLENGYNTVLTERGGGLSEGQVQRLSIARALLANTPILLLDEATSALDETTEFAVIENIKALTDKTVILVTHRQTSIKLCNKIISIH
jgi:ATP-binding cassette subfamily B protein